MEIRRFSKTDSVDDVSRVYAESWKSAYKSIIPQDYLDKLDDCRWSGFIANELSNLWVASDGERIVGTSTYAPARDKKYSGWGEIISIYLLPQHSRHGIGTKLLKASMDSLFLMKFNKIYLWVLEDNYPARDFYEKNGFYHNDHSGDTREITIGGKRLNEIRYIYKK
ncbi:MAG: GNAT family N-acetyltransferase [Eubacteriales bacterium]|nr:GNAT family N-acetyltransferase [Eubacteriales bacterium]